MGFSESLLYGSIGELIVSDYFSKFKGVKSVVDVRGDKYFQSIDVDYLFEDYNGQFTWVEVKTDSKAHATGNLVYEKTTSGHIGCLEKTKAQIIVYYIPTSGNIYLVSTKNLRNYIATKRPPLKSFGDNATGYLLDIGDLERTGVIQSMYTSDYATEKEK